MAAYQESCSLHIFCVYEVIHPLESGGDGAVTPFQRKPNSVGAERLSAHSIDWVILRITNRFPCPPASAKLREQLGHSQTMAITLARGNSIR